MTVEIAGPAPSAELLTPAQLALEVPVGAKWIRECCNDGSLHSHRTRDVRKARRFIPRAVGLAWAAGHDEDDQRRVCPLCLARAPSGPPATTRGRRTRSRP